MRKDEIIKSLTEFGLSENESRVYISSLSLGSASVLDIAKASQLKRTTAYSIIESLKNKGLMKTEVNGLKNHLSAESPERLEKIIEFKKEQLKKVLPELQAIHSFKDEGSFIKYYEGARGFKAAYATILDELKPGDEYLIMSNVKKVMGIDETYLNAFISERAEMDIKIRTILQDDPYAREYAKLKNGGNQKIMFFPKHIDLETNLIILPNKVIITQTNQPIITTVIENRSIVQMHHEQFNIIWDSIK